MIKQCKLLEVPPIGEMNHGLGLCYCQLCDCGEHVCPADINKNQHYLKSAIRSNYKKDFTKKPMTRSQPYLRGCALNAGTNKMDLKTITQQDFLGCQGEKTKSAKYEKEDNARVLKFAGVSQYKSEYPHWGHYEFIHVGSFRKAFMNPNVKLSPVTSYTQNFCNDIKVPRTMSQKKLISPNPVTACVDFFPQTTSRECFKGFLKGNFPERVQNKAFGIVPLESPAKCYETLYMKDFKGKTPNEAFQRKRDVGHQGKH